MRPPASNLKTEGSMVLGDVISPGLTLKDVGDWRNLTTDTSIQIALLGDNSFFNRSQEHSICLRHVDTIECEPVDLSTRRASDECSRQPQRARTLVSLDSLATTSGRLLDSRLIFSSSRDNGKTSASRRRLTHSSSQRSQRPASLSPTTSDKLWHSDSELYYPPGECIHMESKSVEDLSNISREALVMPIEAVMNSTKVSEIKTVPLLESDRKELTSDSETNEEEANNSYVLATSAGIKPSAFGNKVYRKLSKSLRRKRKTLSNMKYLNDIFKSKDTTQENKSVQIPIDKENSHSESLSMATETQKDTPVCERKRHISCTSNKVSLCTRTNQSENQDKRRPVLGVRMRTDEKIQLDDLDLEFVCSVKRQIATNATTPGRKNRIKTNGSLGMKPNTNRIEKLGYCSPKRMSNRRCGASGLRPKRLVSTV